MVPKIFRKLRNNKSTTCFKWTVKANQALEEVKRRLTSAPLLVSPNFRKPFIIQCDASKTGIEGVLEQLDDDGVERTIAFFSRKLNQQQQKYCVKELECLAAVLGIDKFREYVEGLEYKVIADHASLKWLDGHLSYSITLLTLNTEKEG